MPLSKITFIGAGRVGEAAAQIAAKEELAREITLLGVRDGVAEGTALDLAECAALFGFDVAIRGGTDPALMTGSEVLVISAGLPRKPGMSRSDVLAANLPVIDAIAAQARRFAPDALALVVTNPVDVLTYRFAQQTGWGRQRVLGLSGALDGARMASFIALETGFSVTDVRVLVIGGHGDSMLPLPRFSTVAGIPIGEFLDAPALERIVARTRGGGAEILALKKNSSAYDAPGAAIAQILDAIAHDRHRILTGVATLDGEYGLSGLALGMPIVVGRAGVERILELRLSAEERSALEASARAVKDDLGRMMR